jgi:hypothetical protein
MGRHDPVLLKEGQGRVLCLEEAMIARERENNVRMAFLSLFLS